LLKTKASIFVLIVVILVGLFLTYSNHFNNTFHFDDSHTIENNAAIKELTIGKFFKDGTTFSSLPSNQSYRPLTTTENAIDFAVTNSLNPKPFHIHIFIFYLLTCLVFGLFVYELSKNKLLAIITASIFAFLTVNAETVNYIIQRAEITSALCILLGLYFYVKQGFFKRTHLYLVFPLIGFFSKEMTFVFSPLLFLYILVFEEDVHLLRFYKKQEFKGLLVSFKKAVPSILLTAAFLVFYAQMLPPTFSSGGLSKFEYFITQPWVVTHYMITYFFPFNLSADTDWVTFKTISDYRVILGFAIIVFLIWAALKMIKNERTKPIAFGLLWFFIALIPTSTIVPFSEVLNDHRTFIPYLGLTVATVFGIKYLLQKFNVNYKQNGSVKLILTVIIIGFIGANAYGVYQRNKVWETEESLWKDVTLKSPKNGRGMMNYGLALMAKSDYTNAEIYFNKAAKLNPTYTYIYINLGILKNATDDKIAAEQNFKYAIHLDPIQHNCWYYYGEFLFKEGRFLESTDCFKNVNQYSPSFLNTDYYLLQSYHQLSNWEALTNYSNTLLKNNPNHSLAKQYLEIAKNKTSINDVLELEISKNPSAEKYLDLSLKHYNNEEFKKCISAAKNALKLNPNYTAAYNNIGMAYFELLDYENSIKAFNKALELEPNNKLAKNNLAISNSQKHIFKALNTAQEKSDFYLNLSLEKYNKKQYKQCIKFAELSNELSPNPNALNNICTAYNQLGNYTKAIEACNKALKMNPNHEFAKGNLTYAIQQSKK